MARLLFNAVFVLFVTTRCVQSENGDCESIKEQMPLAVEINSDNFRVNVKSECKEEESRDYKFLLTCTSEWCKGTKEEIQQNSVNFCDNNSSTAVSLEKELAAFTEYEPTISTNGCKKIYPRIKTNPGRPNTVQNFSVFCNNGGSLGVRWKPPYPPTGTISSYDIIVVQTLKSIQHPLKNDSFDCKFWKDYQCSTIENLTENLEYDLSIRAKVSSVADSGDPVEETAYTKKQGKIDVDLTYSSENLTAILYWENMFDNSCLPKLIKIDTTPQINGAPFSFSLEEGRNNYNLHLDAAENYNLSVVTVDFGEQRRTEANIVLVRNKLNQTLFDDNILIEVCKTNNECTLKIPKPKSFDLSRTYHLLLQENSAMAMEIYKNFKDGNLKEDTKDIKTLKHEELYLTARFSKISDMSSCIAYIFDDKEMMLPIGTCVEVEPPVDQEKKSSWLLSSTVALIALGTLIAGLIFLKVKYNFQLSICEKGYSAVRTTMENTLKTHPTTYSSPIKCEDLQDYLKDRLNENPRYDTIIKQFSKVPMQCGVSNEAKLSHNREKNRYTNTVPYDTTRVALNRRKKEKNYINASYINGFEGQPIFIATQGPLKNTVNDFWLMIWQQNVRTIVMLTDTVEDGVEKCEKYWPDLAVTSEYEGISVTCSAAREYLGFLIRTFVVSYEGEERQIEHYHCTFWPDYGVPKHPEMMKSFLEKLLTVSQDSPIVVHCSAGCGRTGTFILCDIAIRMARKTVEIDFLKILYVLRTQRPFTIFNEQQYVFTHFVVSDFLNRKPKSVQVDDNVYSNIDQSMKKIDFFQKAIKKDSYLFDIPEEDTKSVTVKNISCICCSSKKFIVVKQPTQEILEKFWRFVIDSNVGTIISLNNLENSSKFWKFNGSITLDLLEEIEKDGYDVLKIQAANKEIVIIYMKTWQSKASTPSSIADLLKVWQETQDISGKCEGGIMLTCCDGHTATGMFVALNILLERIKLEKVCDVYSAVKFAKQHEPRFVDDKSQIKFLYDAATRYIEDTYPELNYPDTIHL